MDTSECISLTGLPFIHLALMVRKHAAFDDEVELKNDFWQLRNSNMIIRIYFLGSSHGVLTHEPHISTLNRLFITLEHVGRSGASTTADLGQLEKKDLGFYLHLRTTPSTVVKELASRISSWVQLITPSGNKTNILPIDKETVTCLPTIVGSPKTLERSKININKPILACTVNPPTFKRSLPKLNFKNWVRAQNERFILDLTKDSDSS
jgi:hypothetical protein